ncbi:hypothetical protein ASZ90_019869 [hydrocarbon metagenome]|uniref:Uncharacterized protein n=1 Tax=hydrocarbon metagenome TaxID=938273 RepID=A0A0W8E2U7_9ZZZZ
MLGNAPNSEAANQLWRVNGLAYYKGAGVIILSANSFI